MNVHVKSFHTVLYSMVPYSTQSNTDRQDLLKNFLPATTITQTLSYLSSMTSCTRTYYPTVTALKLHTHFECRNHLGRGLCIPHAPQATQACDWKVTHHACQSRFKMPSFGPALLSCSPRPHLQLLFTKYTLPLLSSSSLYLRPCPRTIHCVSLRAAPLHSPFSNWCLSLMEVITRETRASSRHSVKSSASASAESAHFCKLS